MKRFLPIILLLLISTPVIAVVDLLNPVDQAVLKNSTVTFEYYVSMPGVTSCTVNADDLTFPDPGPESNAINSVQVNAVASGAHKWNVTCTTGNVTESSVQRNFTVDLEPPTLSIVSPVDGEYSNIALDFIPVDAVSESLECDIFWDGSLIDSANVQSNTHHSKSYTVAPGSKTLEVSCSDEAGHVVTESRALIITPDIFLTLSLNKETYGLTEPVLLTIDSVPSANITIDICPNQQGFVQCTTALLDSDSFPQTITLPYLNKTGEYLVDGIAQYGNDAAVSQVTYSLKNTMTASISTEGLLEANKTIILKAKVSGGIPPYNFIWNLSNGTILSGISEVEVKYNNSGKYNESVTARDNVGNSFQAKKELEIIDNYKIIFNVVENETGGAIVGADVDFGGTKMTTIQGGLAFFDLKEGRYRLFASAQGYRFVVGEYFINKSQTIDVRMVRETGGPQIIITEPQEGGTAPIPALIRYKVIHTKPTTCTLLLGTNTGWFTENGTAEISDAGIKEFQIGLSEGSHSARIECTDGLLSGSSSLVSFVVSPDADVPPAEVVDTQGDEIYLQQLLEEFNTAIQQIENYDQKDKQAVELLGFDKKIRNAKRAIQQYIRDIDGLRYRTDLDELGREAEYNNILEKARTLSAATPRGLEVLDKKTFVKYVEEDDVDKVVESIAGLDGITDNHKLLSKLLLEDQQKFTVSTKAMQVQYKYADDTTSSVTVISRDLTYADDLDDGYAVLEIIPKKVVNSANELVMITKAEVLKEDPVLRFGTIDSLTYIVPKKIDFTRIEEIKTVLTRNYRDNGNKITGFAIFSGGAFWSYGTPAIILFVLILGAYLVYYFDLLRQIKYIFYKLGKKEQVHYLRVLIGDAEDQLAASNYDKAELIYKEVRMTYDTLSDMARNDLYEEVIGLVEKMDEYYFNLVMVELDQHIKAGDTASAIDSYEKLIGTFERLDMEKQQQLVDAVTGIGKRLGVSS